MSLESYPNPRPAKRVAPAKRRAGLALLGLALAGFGCHTTPVTGRASVNVFSPEEDVALGREAYQQSLAGSTIVTSGPEYDMVVRVMERLAVAADDPRLDDVDVWEWEVTLVLDDQMVNAYALPGGKMAVYTGILPVCATEAGLAVVMGHEIGHVVARHGTERVTQGMGVSTALSMLSNGDVQAIAAVATDLLWGKPFGRNMESEADHIGLILMARAGYDPREAPAFWERMSQGTGESPPEFFSTHPSHETRVQRLQELMPEALAEWTGAP